ncbi:AzlD domain-containing protein [Paracoccus sp. 1_MG-2023]|uniref:AzlD domain-containing protein n=1 Tax=unclassified Paracoccus (in: a-proteobacteria) TaxID=2688777 RepID=UPI001C092597|nr:MULTISPECIES: AzlD domain-containing protein [unclassified Paracoccus (in: a-proteobacteria)]MBU2956968.1 AzlD domain-containing protein [Paracoccus sp. C2R09]MDO6668165.1 AzlD domain-containing protein [Paracoccus sp. 1_MG-2023]
MPVSDLTVWAVILILGVGTYLIRWSFLGVLGGRDLPEWVLRLLRYTPVAVLPALVAPLVVWPAATGGEPDPARMAAAAATVIAGLWTHNVLAAIAAGGGTLALMLYVLG